MKGFAALPIIIIIVVILLGFFMAGSFFKGSENKHSDFTSSSPSSKEDHQISSGGYGYREALWEKGGISLQHYWPGEGNFSNEETEILIFNDSNESFQIKTFNLDYAVEGKVYPHKSGTWEKYPSKTSWEKLDYLNISPQYYQGEKLIVKPGEKGKLHWHINFGPNPLSGQQTIELKLTLQKGSETLTIDEQFNRNSGTVFSKEIH